MASNVARRDDYDASSSISRGTRRELARIDQQEAVRLARIEAQQRTELSRVVGNEQLAYVQGERRLEYGEALTRKAIIKSSGLHDLIDTLSRGDVSRELSMRAQAARYEQGAALYITCHMAGPLL